MKKNIEELNLSTSSYPQKPTNQPYLQAAIQGSAVQNNRQGLSPSDIRKLNANSFQQVEPKEYATIHFQGLKSSARVKSIKNFMKEIGINIRKILRIWFIGRDILEITVYSDYVNELTILMQNAQNEQKYKEILIKRIKFEALDQNNIRNPNCKASAKVCNWKSEGTSSMKPGFINKSYPIIVQL